jgi:hypothetical protein
VGVSLEELRTSYLDFEPPLYGRFKGTKDNAKYPGTIRLEYISAIYNIVRGDKSLYHLAVKEEMERWLNADMVEREKLH